MTGVSPGHAMDGQREGKGVSAVSYCFFRKIQTDAIVFGCNGVGLGEDDKENAIAEK